MYVDKYSDRLSEDEKMLSEALIAKKRKKQKMIFLGIAVAVAVCLILEAASVFFMLDNGYMTELAEENLETGGKHSKDTGDGLLGFIYESLWFFILELGILAVMAVNIKKNYDLLTSFYVTCTDKYKIISIRETTDKKYPFTLTATEYGKSTEKQFRISSSTYEMIRDSRDVVVIYYPDIHLFTSERKGTGSIYYLFVPKIDNPYDFIKADF